MEVDFVKRPVKEKENFTYPTGQVTFLTRGKWMTDQKDKHMSRPNVKPWLLFNNVFFK